MTLGVRVPNPSDANKVYDIAPDDSGDVHPNMGGMSISPTLESLLQNLPSRMIPERLQHLAPDATGRNNVFVWRMGEGAFTISHIGERLQLRPDPNKPARHGFVEPREVMSLELYREALHDTQSDWVIDEPEEL